MWCYHRWRVLKGSHPCTYLKGNETKLNIRRQGRYKYFIDHVHDVFWILTLTPHVTSIANSALCLKHRSLQVSSTVNNKNKRKIDGERNAEYNLIFDVTIYLRILRIHKSFEPWRFNVSRIGGVVYPISSHSHWQGGSWKPPYVSQGNDRQLASVVCIT